MPLPLIKNLGQNIYLNRFIYGPQNFILKKYVQLIQWFSPVKAHEIKDLSGSLCGPFDGCSGWPH